ncbi:MAG: hypothetical protein IE885_08300 [Campylobacterales bacterium]|nr:hypothetical protein [Campylobacterales bacterium]
MKQLLLKIIFFFYLFSSLLGAVHIHLDQEEAHECKVCIVVNTMHYTDEPKQHLFDLFIEMGYEDILFIQNSYVYRPIKGFFATAPPLYSL